MRFGWRIFVPRGFIWLRLFPHILLTYLHLRAWLQRNSGALNDLWLPKRLFCGFPMVEFQPTSEGHKFFVNYPNEAPSVPIVSFQSPLQISCLAQVEISPSRGSKHLPKWGYWLKPAQRCRPWAASMHPAALWSPSLGMSTSMQGVPSLMRRAVTGQTGLTWIILS